MPPSSNLAFMPPRGCVIEQPKVERDTAVKPSTLAKLAALPQCDDAEVELPEACLLMTDAEVSIIAAKAEALAEAQAELVAADQALARAETLARGVPALKQAAGVAAAQGFSGKKVDALTAQKAAADLAAAESAALAVPALVDERDKAKDAAHRALGSLRGNAQVAVKNALMRQAAEYQRLARELARVSGHMAAAVELLNDGDVMSAMSYFATELKVPAAPGMLLADWRGVEEHDFRQMMARHGHGAVTAHATAAKGWLTAQLAAAVPGVPASKLMK